jgi:diguanylate cyclase
MTQFLALLLMVLSACQVHADNLKLYDIQTRVNLDSSVLYIEDANASLDIGEVLQQALPWQQGGPKSFNKSYNQSAWWLRLDIDNAQDKPQRRLIELSYAVLDHVDVYIVAGGQVLASHMLGDKQPFYERVFDHRFFVIPVEWQPSQSLQIYLRVKSSSAVQAPLTLWEEKAFYGFDTTRTIMNGIFFGIMLVIAAYNLLIFCVLGERTYLLYVGYVICMPLFLASLGGYSFQYMWPTFTDWNDESILFFLSGVVVFGVAFTRSFLVVQRYSPGLDRLLVIALAGGIVLAATTFMLPYYVNIKALIAWATFACILALLSGVFCWYSQQKVAQYYTIAWVSMLSGGVILALNKAGVLPANLFTEYATHIGSALEVVLLSFALAERINEERRLRFEAQEEALTGIRQANEELEYRVQERTKELEAMTCKLRELSNTDQLTGLHNRRFFDSQIKMEWLRACRYQHPISIIAIDIDHFKSVNDRYGHMVGDECLREIARRVGLGVRCPTDVAARYGGEEFVMLLPETTREGAVIVAERVRKSVEVAHIDTRAGELSLTISAGIYCVTPENDNFSGIDILLEKADECLYRAKAMGRNCIFPVPD